MHRHRERSVWCGLMLGLLAFCLALPVRAAGDVYIYPRPESPRDTRYAYEWALLAAALDASSPEYGPYVMQPSAMPMNQARAAQELQTGRGHITVFARGTLPELEASLLPLRIPLDKGLLGYRIFLIRAEDQPRFAAIRTLGELRRLAAGQLDTWEDVRILRSASFPVVTGSDYEGTFKMLGDRRFDFFPRGPDEAYREYDERHAAEHGLAVEKTLMLHYRSARYFFFPRSPDGQRLAARVKLGLTRMQKNGRFDALFRQYKGALIERAGLRQRRIFDIGSGGMSPQTPFLQKELWYDPLTD